MRVQCLDKKKRNTHDNPAVKIHRSAHTVARCGHRLSANFFFTIKRELDCASVLSSPRCALLELDSPVL